MKQTKLALSAFTLALGLASGDRFAVDFIRCGGVQNRRRIRVESCLRAFAFENRHKRRHIALNSCESGPEDTMEQSQQNRGQEWLKAAQVRPTKQRLALAELLVGDGLNRHVTAESLYAAASDHGDQVSLATVYNTLRAFCDAGLLNEITVDGHRSYFDTRVDEHPHYYWEGTGKLTDAPKTAVAFAKEPEAPEGTRIARVDVVIRLADQT